MNIEIQEWARQEVERLFANCTAQRGQICRNPVTAGSYVAGEDPIKPQKEAAARVLAAREWFRRFGPPGLPPLPLNYDEREDLKSGGVPHVWAWFARSLEGRDYNVLEHPGWADFAPGVMASEFAPGFIKNDEELKRLYPPKALPGLGPGLYWLPPAEHEEVMANLRRHLARQAAAGRALKTG
jgi:hypothetical protein